MKGLEGRTALVTGAADGIGKAIARRLAAEGCAVGILDVNESGAYAVASESASGTAGAWVADISDYAEVAAAVAALEGTLGPVEFLINNAGWDRAAPFLETDEEFRRKVIAINLFGPINVQYVVLRGMAERGFGRVVTIASDAGRVGSSGEAVYSACKAA